jgi:hypothetical protein
LGVGGDCPQKKGDGKGDKENLGKGQKVETSQFQKGDLNRCGHIGNYDNKNDGSYQKHN